MAAVQGLKRNRSVHGAHALRHHLSHNYRLLLLALMACFAAAPAPLHAGVFVLNGNFEDGFSPVNTPLTGVAGTGWDVTTYGGFGNQVDLADETSPAHVYGGGHAQKFTVTNGS